MLCHRCSYPLPAHPARCVRCLALNPRHVDADLVPVPLSFAGDEPAPAPAAFLPPETPPPHPRRLEQPLRAAQVLAWSVDLGILAACTAGHVALAYAVLSGSPQGARVEYTIDLLRGGRLPLLWLALFGVLALAYSWTFGALGGRTPGLAVAGLRIASVRGGAPTPREALARAALSIASAGLGLFGFAFALLDERGQTLHDKMAGTRLERA